MRDIQFKLILQKFQTGGHAPAADAPVLDPPLCKMIYSKKNSKYTIYHPKIYIEVWGNLNN